MEKFGDAQASRVIQALETRATRKLRDGAQVATTWGTVAEISADQKTAGAYLYGENTSEYVSGGFRVPETTYLTVGDVVKVAMNYATGERWIDEVHYPATAYKKVAVDIKSGAVRFGGGATSAEISLYRDASAAYLRMDSTGEAALILRATGSAAVGIYGVKSADSDYRWFISETGLRFGSGAVAADVNLYRASANILKTDDEFHAAGLITALAGITVSKVGTTSTITFPAQSNDPGYIQHIESSNAAEMRFSVSDDRGSSDFFAFGSAPAGAWSEGMVIMSDGSHYWSGTASERDTNLYRAGANILRTDDDLIVALRLSVGTTTRTAGQINLIASTASDAGIGFGTDVNLYRVAADHLKTDDRLSAAHLQTAGVMTVGGSSFPGGAAANDVFFRNDLRLWFYYTGSQWLTSELFMQVIPNENVAAKEMPITVTTSDLNRTAFRSTIAGASDVYLIDHVCSFYVGTGTALGASHKWVGSMRTVDTAGTATARATVNIDSGSSTAYRQTVTAINASAGANMVTFQTNWTKTGTPGSLYVWEYVTYRLIAT